MTEAGSHSGETLEDLLVRIRNGFPLFSPILISVHQDALYDEEATTERTVTSHQPTDWAEEYTREYAHEEYIIVGSNSLAEGLDKPVSIGRSRQCDVRVENESVSKLHATIHHVPRNRAAVLHAKALCQVVLTQPHLSCKFRHGEVAM